jgi:hypothetical protein
VRKLDNKVAEKVMLKAGLKPLEPYKDSRTKWKCLCVKCKKTIYIRYSKHGYACGWCAGNKSDLKKINQVMKKAKYKPLEPYRTARSKWKCLHISCGNVVYLKYNTIQQGKGGCKPCGNLESSKKQRLDEKIAVERMLKAGVKPSVPYTNNSTKWKSTCLKCNRTVFPAYSDIQGGHKGCGYCAGNMVDLKEVMHIMRQAKLKPVEEYKSSKSKWKCKCLRCGETVIPKYEDILQGQGGCRYCAPKGINMNVPSYIYLITNNELYSHKIGMGNYKKVKADDRLYKFIKRGWQTYKVWQMETGSEAIDIEAKIFKIIRNDLKIPVYLSKEQLPVIRGETETINADTITLLELEKIINKVIKGYRNNP